MCSDSQVPFPFHGGTWSSQGSLVQVVEARSPSSNQTLATILLCDLGTSHALSGLQVDICKIGSNNPYPDDFSEAEGVNLLDNLKPFQTGDRLQLALDQREVSMRRA